MNKSMNKEMITVLARRYAQAFMNTYRAECTLSVRQHLQELSAFLRTHNRIIFFLSVSSIPIDTKMNAISFLIEQFALPGCVHKMITLLLKNRRIFLLKYMLDAFEELYQKEHNISFFEMRSAHPLSTDQRTFLRDFLRARTGRDIIYKYVLDPRLIAGIRMHNKTHMWEYSIAARLCAVKLSLMC